MARDYVISTDAVCDLPLEYIKEKKIPFATITVFLDGKGYDDDFGVSLPPSVFYKRMREGAEVSTAQPNVAVLSESFDKHIESGLDVIHISMSSGISGSFGAASIAAEDSMAKHPGSRVVAVDSLCASMGLGFLLYHAMEQKEKGMGFDDMVAWLDRMRHGVLHIFTVDDLAYLQRGGRVSKSSAIIGTLLSIKPVLWVDEEGHLTPIGKIRGRAHVLVDVVNRIVEHVADEKSPDVFISHGDCIEDARTVEKMLKERLDKPNILMSNITPAIGAHSGPGTIAVFCYKKEYLKAK